MSSKPRCKLCNIPEVKDPDMGYISGFYEMELKMGSTPVVYEVCSKCNRCSLKNSDLGDKLFDLPRKDKTQMLIEDLKLKTRLFTTR